MAASTLQRLAFMVFPFDCGLVGRVRQFSRAGSGKSRLSSGISPGNAWAARNDVE
jgi:hypothetical protein